MYIYIYIQTACDRTDDGCSESYAPVATAISLAKNCHTKIRLLEANFPVECPFIFGFHPP